MPRTKQTTRKSVYGAYVRRMRIRDLHPYERQQQGGGAAARDGTAASTSTADRAPPSNFPLLDLDDHVLGHILSFLGPEPCQLAAASQTCKKLHEIAHSSAWKALCYKLAAKTCDDLVAPGEAPPGGWQTLYKMLVWCPGVEPEMWRMEDLVDEDAELEDLHSHVEEHIPKLSKTRGKRFLRPCLRKDRLYLTKLACKHYQMTNESGHWLCAFRGIFKDFAKSVTWAKVKEEKVDKYIKNTAATRNNDAPPVKQELAFTPLSGAHPGEKKSLETGCPFCGVRMWDIGFGEGSWDHAHSLALNFASYFIIKGVGFKIKPGENPDTGEYSDSYDDFHQTSAYVCENGHLSGVYRGDYPVCYDTESSQEAEDSSDDDSDSDMADSDEDGDKSEPAESAQDREDSDKAESAQDREDSDKANSAQDGEEDADSAQEGENNDDIDSAQAGEDNDDEVSAQHGEDNDDIDLVRTGAESDGEEEEDYPEETSEDENRRDTRVTIKSMKRRNPLHFLDPKERTVFKRHYNRKVHRYLGPVKDIVNENVD